MLKQTIYLLIKAIRLKQIKKEILKAEKHREKYNLHCEIVNKLWNEYNEYYYPDSE